MFLFAFILPLFFLFLFFSVFFYYFPSLLCLFLSSPLLLLTFIFCYALSLFLMSIRPSFNPQNEPVSITLSQLSGFTHDLLSHLVYSILRSFFFFIYIQQSFHLVWLINLRNISFPFLSRTKIKSDASNLPRQKFRSQKRNLHESTATISQNVTLHSSTSIGTGD